MKMNNDIMKNSTGKTPRFTGGMRGVVVGDKVGVGLTRHFVNQISILPIPPVLQNGPNGSLYRRFNPAGCSLLTVA